MTITLDTQPLPSDLLWSDEFDWSPSISAQEYAVTGALVVDSATRLAGRPVTLEADNDRAWINRASLQALYALTTPANRVMTLSLHGVSYSVIWRPGAEPINARPLFPLGNPQADLAYVVTLRLTEI